MEILNDKPNDSVFQNIKKIRKLFSDLSTNLCLNQREDLGKSHIMGEENLGEAKRIFFDSTKSIKNTLQTYAKWYHLNDNNLEKQLSHKYLQVINEEANQLEAMEALKENIKTCSKLGEIYLRETAKKRHRKFESENKVLLSEKLQSIATELSLGHHFTDINDSMTDEPMESNEVVEITSIFHNNSFHMDISVKNNYPVDVTILNSDEDNYPSIPLLQLLQEGNYEEFKETLRRITKNYKVLDFHSVQENLLRIIEKDLLLFQAKSIENTYDEYTQIQFGHGKVERMGEGIQILFFASPSYFLASEDEKTQLRQSHRWILPNPNPPKEYSRAKIHRAYIEIQEIYDTNERNAIPIKSQLLYDGSSPATWKDWQTLDLSNLLEAPITYSLYFYPPIPISVHSPILSSLFPTKYLPLSNSSISSSLLSLILNSSSINRDEEHYAVSMPFESSIEMFQELYHFIYTEVDSRAVMLYRIPFKHPSQLLQLLNDLRQQVVFNELLLSLANDPLTIDHNASMYGNEQQHQQLLLEGTNSRVFEVVCNSPFSIEITYPDMSIGNFVRMEIKIMSGGKIAASQTPQSPRYSNSYLSSLLQTSLHIPLTLYTLFQNSNSSF